VSTKLQVDARKVRLKQQDALAMLADVDEIYSTQGRRVTHVDLRKDKPNTETLLSLLLGPTGNLRAPTLRVGRTLLVGFDQTTYNKMFG
jgi:arsenate reductase-like glutaredoxin family protein